MPLPVLIIVTFFCCVIQQSSNFATRVTKSIETFQKIAPTSELNSQFYFPSFSFVCERSEHGSLSCISHQGLHWQYSWSRIFGAIFWAQFIFVSGKYKVISGRLNRSFEFPSFQFDITHYPWFFIHHSRQPHPFYSRWVNSSNLLW